MRRSKSFKADIEQLLREKKLFILHQYLRQNACTCKGYCRCTMVGWLSTTTATLKRRRRPDIQVSPEPRPPIPGDGDDPTPMASDRVGYAGAAWSSHAAGLLPWGSTSSTPGPTLVCARNKTPVEGPLQTCLDQAPRLPTACAHPLPVGIITPLHLHSHARAPVRRVRRDLSLESTPLGDADRWRFPREWNVRDASSDGGLADVRHVTTTGVT